MFGEIALLTTEPEDAVDRPKRLCTVPVPGIVDVRLALMPSEDAVIAERDVIDDSELLPVTVPAERTVMPVDSKTIGVVRVETSVFANIGPMLAKTCKADTMDSSARRAISVIVVNYE